MITQNYLVEGMTCGHCVGSVKREVEAIDGVTEALVDLEARSLTVHADREITPAAVREAVDEAGYTLITVP